MAQLIVRNLDDEIVRRLKRRAAERGRSVEAEHDSESSLRNAEKTQIKNLSLDKSSVNPFNTGAPRPAVGLS